MAQEDSEYGNEIEEESGVASLVGADAIDGDELSDRESHDASDVEGIPTHADASTPEWSEVEQGRFPSPATTPRSDSEVELIGVRGHPAPLWVLDLTLSDYIAWTRQGRVQSYAHNPFEQESDPNSIMWPMWWTMASDQLSDDEDGTIYVVDGVCMLRCTTTMVLFEDGIIRPVFVVWLLEKVSGMERMAALIREQSRPIVRAWPAEELSKAAPWPQAKMPTAPTPKGFRGDAAHAYMHSEKASSSSPGYISGPAYTLELTTPKSSSAAPKSSSAVPKASAAVPKASAAVPKASAAVPKASAAVPKASAAVPETDSVAMRCVYIEEENMDHIPTLVGAEPSVTNPKPWKYEAREDDPTLVGMHRDTITAHRLECTDHPAANIAVSQQQPSVLVDSGANETIRPWDETITETGCKKTSVVTASGDRVPALRTKDGELCIKSSGESRDWLLSVRRLVEAGGTFEWTSNGAELTFPDREGRKQSIKRQIVNGLPFLDWTEFRPIRILLPKYKSQGGTVFKAAANDPQWRSCETCSVEELYRTLWEEECYHISVAERQHLIESEAWAKEMLGRPSVTFSEVRELVQKAGLRGQRTRRDRLLEDKDQGKRVQMWVFGMCCHGGITGLTSLTRERPFLTRLLARMMRQELPDLSFTTVALAIDSTLKPHRDLANAVNSRAGIVGISDFQRIKRRISADKIKVGKLLDVCQQAQTFDPRQWHGADKHQGVRATVSAYTARQLYNLDRDLTEELKTLDFSLPDIGSTMQVCQTSSNNGSSSIHLPPSIPPATTGQTTNLHFPQTQLDDDDEMMFGYAGFVGSGLSGRCEGCGVVLGEGIERVPVPPWIGSHAEEVEPDSSFSEAAHRRAVELLQRNCSQGLYERHCPDCAEAHGHKRKCRRLSPEDVGRGTLSMDLSGPHPAPFSGHRYFLVANLSMPEGDDIPFSRLLKTKTTEEVARALTSVMCQIVSLAQGTPPVFRIHSDAGKEFIGGSFQKEVESCCLWPTMSAPYTPQQNGKAERLVGLVKGAAGALLLHAQLPLQLWSEAVLEATFLRRCRALKLLIPKDRPRMGDSVLIRKPPLPAEHAFAPRAEEGIFLANDERTPGGARIMVIRDGSTSVRVARLPILKDKSLPRWKLERGPDGQVVWLSTHGDIQWQAKPEDLLTVEEARGEIQPWNTGNAAADLIRARFKPHTQPELLFSLFGHGFMVDPVDLVAAPEAATAATAVNGERSDVKDRYYILSYKVEQDMLKSETEPHRVTIAEDEDASVFTRDGVEEWEREKWVHGLSKELDNMKTKGVLIETDAGKYPDVRAVPSKLVLRKKPIQDSETEESKGIGASGLAEIIKRSRDPRVRLVACGNYERDTKPGDPANYSANPGPDLMRVLISLLARHRRTWSALVLDISCAFLNAPLETAEGQNPVLIQPPSILYRLGLISRGVIWRAARAIYGLRKSPKLWEQERNSHLNDARLLPKSSDQLGVITLREARTAGEA